MKDIVMGRNPLFIREGLSTYQALKKIDKNVLADNVAIPYLSGKVFQQILRGNYWRIPKEVAIPYLSGKVFQPKNLKGGMLMCVIGRNPLFIREGLSTFGIAFWNRSLKRWSRNPLFIREGLSTRLGYDWAYVWILKESQSLIYQGRSFNIKSKVVRNFKRKWVAIPYLSGKVFQLFML